MAQRYVAVMDFGSQTTKLIARRVRALGVFSKILPWKTSAAALAAERPVAIILSGGPESLNDAHAPRPDAGIFDLGIPILGICYGMQLMVEHCGGVVKPGKFREFGLKRIKIAQKSVLFSGMLEETKVWMSHFDQADIGAYLPAVASSDTCTHAAVENIERKLYGVQFHPEVSHTACGQQIFSNFLFNVAKAEKNHVCDDVVARKISEIKATVGDNKVIMALSGGVDSSVAAALIARAIGKNLCCIYVNHGLHREREVEEVENLFGQVIDGELRVIDAREQFFSALRGITDPEAKRKTIGRVFIEVFEQEAKVLGTHFLAQGTLYPDVIESSREHDGLSHGIKSHHNVGGLPKTLNLTLLEPLRDLFKDEVRTMGRALGLSSAVVDRQPFPGPGLAVRIPLEVTESKVAMLRSADAIVCQEIERAKNAGELPSDLWQWFAILLPIQSVGVQGDARVTGETVVVRVVDSVDAMTADWTKVPHHILATIASRIGNEVRGVSRVLYDITQKPPGTIEWE